MAAGVIFDFHNTVVRADSFAAWLTDAMRVADCAEAPAADIIPVLRQIWSRASVRHPDGAWDLDPALHRQVFEEVLTQETPCSAALAAALYDVMTRHWVAVDGALSLLHSLHDRGVRLALVSNIALDVRPRLHELGMLDLFHTIALSYEVGLVKPDPRLFQWALSKLQLAPSDCVMVGDSPRSDGGAISAGICAVLVPLDDDLPQLGRVAAMLAAI